MPAMLVHLPHFLQARRASSITPQTAAYVWSFGALVAAVFTAGISLLSITNTVVHPGSTPIIVWTITATFTGALAMLLTKELTAECLDLASTTYLATSPVILIGLISAGGSTIADAVSGLCTLVASICALNTAGVLMVPGLMVAAAIASCVSGLLVCACAACWFMMRHEIQ